MDLPGVYSAAHRLPYDWIQSEPGAQWRALREDRFVSQRHLAQEAGVSQSFVCRLEAGRCDATLAVWRKLFFALGCLAPFAPVPYAEEVDDLLEKGREERERRQWDGLLARSPRRYR